ncbi:MAG: DUF892 family protein [Cyclobacteriaceae bacterium]
MAGQFNSEFFDKKKQRMSRRSLKSFLDEQLNEILVSEILILDVLPMIESKLSNPQLLNAIGDLKKLMRSQQKSIQKILNKVGAKLQSVRPEEFETLMAEMISLSELSSGEIVDMHVAYSFRRLFRFQKICYGAAGIYARSLGFTEISHDLQRLIDNKESCFETIAEIAEALDSRTSDG